LRRFCDQYRSSYGAYRPKIGQFVGFVSLDAVGHLKESTGTFASRLVAVAVAVMGVIGIAVLLGRIPHNSALGRMANNQPRLAH
jgi:hypothetical protein